MARLVYKDGNAPVAVGDVVILNSGEVAEVEYFRPPHSPASEGRVSVRCGKQTSEYYVGVIGARWIERTDR